ncbi:MAG: maleylpyruvate isomerase family mycothiol-dependent enzyme [Desertimonas sp.]
MLTQERYVELLAEDAAALLAAAGAADPGSAVPTCPGWNTMDLVWHIGEVHAFWATVLEGMLAAPPADWPPARPDDADGVWAFARQSAERVIAAVAVADPDATVWTWAEGADDAGFVIRRMAQETAVHRLDAEQTAGREVRIDTALAADGLDEFLVRFYPFTVRAGRHPGGSIHLHCTDTEGEWTLDAAGALSRGHAKGDAALRGSAHDLLAVVWRRQPIDSIEVFGDQDLASSFVDATRSG